MSTPDELYSVYCDFYKMCVAGGLDESKNPLWAIWRRLDAALLHMGLLEKEEEEEE